MKNTNENNIKLYNEILSEEEIVTIGLIIRKFEREQISYHQLKKLLKDQNVELTPRFRDVSNQKMTIMQAKDMKKRFEKEAYDPIDFDGYIISGFNYENVLIRNDGTMIEILAKNGDEDAKRTRDAFLRLEKSYKIRTTYSKRRTK